MRLNGFFRIHVNELQIKGLSTSPLVSDALDAQSSTRDHIISVRRRLSGSLNHVTGDRNNAGQSDVTSVLDVDEDG
jgi:hypothetical protein